MGIDPAAVHSGIVTSPDVLGHRPVDAAAVSAPTGRRPRRRHLPTTTAAAGLGFGNVKIREATRADLGGVALVADQALRSAYEELIPAATVDRYLQATYSPGSLSNRLADHPIFVVEIDGEICSFADAFIQDGGIVIAEICTMPNWRRQGCARNLVQRLTRLDARLPLSADVLLGNDAGERFYESLDFVPGETVQMRMFDTAVVERRWWHPPLAGGSADNGDR